MISWLILKGFFVYTILHTVSYVLIFCRIKGLMKIYNGGNSICGNQVKNFCTNVVFIEWSFLEAGGGGGGGWGREFGPLLLHIWSNMAEVFTRDSLIVYLNTV